MKKEDILLERLKELEIDIDWDCIDLDGVDSEDELRELLQESDIFNVEIIYHSNAIEYLSDNDPSLMESLGLASDMGYDASNLNSEILASIHASQELINDYDNLSYEIEGIFEELELID